MTTVHTSNTPLD